MRNRSGLNRSRGSEMTGPGWAVRPASQSSEPPSSAARRAASLSGSARNGSDGSLPVRRRRAAEKPAGAWRSVIAAAALIRCHRRGPKQSRASVHLRRDASLDPTFARDPALPLRPVVVVPRGRAPAEAECAEPGCADRLFGRVRLRCGTAAVRDGTPLNVRPRGSFPSASMRGRSNTPPTTTRTGRRACDRSGAGRAAGPVVDDPLGEKRAVRRDDQVAQKPQVGTAALPRRRLTWGGARSGALRPTAPLQAAANQPARSARPDELDARGYDRTTTGVNSWGNDALHRPRPAAQPGAEYGFPRDLALASLLAPPLQPQAAAQMRCTPQASSPAPRHAAQHSCTFAMSSSSSVHITRPPSATRSQRALPPRRTRTAPSLRRQVPPFQLP